MANTLMGDLQAAFRSITGSVQSYEGDWHAYLDTQGVPKGQWDARVWQYGNLMGLRSHTASSAHEYFLHQGAIGTVSAYAGGFTASGDYFSTPDSVANSITGDITLIVEAALDDWTPSAVNVLIAKDSVSAGGRSYALNIQTSGAPRFNFSLDGSTIISVTADAIPAFTDGIRSHIAVERTAATGKVRFYTSPDHITWTLLGTEQTEATGNIFDGNAVVQFGNLASLAYDLKGKIYDSEGYAGLAISGTGAVMKFDFDPEDSTGGSSWTSSETGEVWTANGGAYAYKYWGYSPTLSLNFLTGTLDPRITFTRASGATYTDSTGTLKLATSNTPRFDYDPVTLSAKGLLIEEQRTNLLTYSDQFDNAAWIKNNITVTSNAITSPDGNLTADKMIATAVAGIHKTRVAIVLGTQYTFTIYAKAAEYQYLTLNDDASGASGIGVNLSTGEYIVGVSLSSVGSINKLSNGWYRIKFSWIAGSAVMNVHLQTSLTTSDSNFTGDGTSGVYLWGAQLEAGSFATSYIPTTTAQATRAASLGTFATSGALTSTVGTIFITHDLPSGRVVLGDGATALITSQGAGRIALSFDSSGSLISYNGGAATSGGALTLGATLKLLGNSTVTGCGHITSLTTYNSKFSTSQLQELTA